MKKTIVIFAVGALVLAGLAAWMLEGRVAGDGWEIATTGLAFVLVGFAAALGLTRLRHRRHGEPAEDELSKRIMTRATSLAYYVSLYMWLFVMFIGDKVALPARSLVGTGIAGMAVVFLFCWLGVRFFGTKNV